MIVTTQSKAKKEIKRMEQTTIQNWSFKKENTKGEQFCHRLQETKTHTEKTHTQNYSTITI